MSEKKRSANFSKVEEEKLIKMVLQHKNILESKKTDAVSAKQKNNLWEKLAEQYNSSSEYQNRTAKALKEKYQNIKRGLRKQKAEERKSLFLAGGGPPLAQSASETGAAAELIELMGVSVDGLPSRNDDDALLQKENEANLSKY